MKILHVTEAMGGGVLSMMSLLMNHQANSHHVKLLFSRRRDTPQNVNDFFDASIDVKEIDMHGVKALRSIFELRKMVSRDKIDVVFLHSSVAGFLGRLALRGLNCRVFYIPHCISFMRKDICFFHKYIFVFLESFANSFCKSRILACSKSEGLIIKEYVRLALVDVVENALEISHHSTESEGTTDFDSLMNGRKAIVTVGRVAAQKGVDEFIRIKEKIDMYPEVAKETVFLWIGDGDEILKSKLLESGVKVLGWRSKSYVFDVLRRSFVYLSAARWEGMPVSVLEAMCVKIPCVVSNVAGNIDLIDDGLGGYVYSSIDDAVIKINILFNFPEVGKNFSEFSYLKLLSKYSRSRYFGKMDFFIS